MLEPFTTSVSLVRTALLQTRKDEGSGAHRKLLFWVLIVTITAFLFCSRVYPVDHAKRIIHYRPLPFLSQAF
jgi:hypothetical protein